MKAADRLGAGTAFANARNPRNQAKRQASGDIPMYDLVTLELTDVAPTPLNPRIRFGSVDELLTLGQGLAETQLQPCVAVPTNAYLRLWPEHTEQIGSAVGHVLINGERRWRAAREAGLEKLDFTLRTDLTVVHDGDVQAARARLLDAVLKENLDRKNFDPIEEARGVAALVAAYGDGVRAGQQLNRGKAWVSQRLTLLSLPTSLQDEVADGRISIDDGRWMGARAKRSPDLTGDQLLQLLREHQKEQARAEVAKAAPGPSEGFTAVNPAPPADHPVASKTVPAESATVEAPLPHPEAGFTTVNPVTPDSPQSGIVKQAPVGHASVVGPRPATDAPVAGSGFTVVNPEPATKPEGPGVESFSTSDEGQDFTLSMATPEQIVDALLAELDPDSLARVAELLQERLPSASATQGA